MRILPIGNSSGLAEILLEELMLLEPNDSREKPAGLFIIEKRKIEEEAFLKSTAQPHKHDHSYKAVKQGNKFFERKRKRK